MMLAPKWHVTSELSSKVNFPPGNTVPRFESERFGGDLKENLRAWLQPAPTRTPGAKISLFHASHQLLGKAAWNNARVSGLSRVIALAIHAGVVILLLLPRLEPPGVPHSQVSETTRLIAPDIPPFQIKLPHGKDPAGGGGGGGDHSLLPVTKGRLPRFSPTQIAPPSLPRNANPILLADASLLGPPELQIPSPNLNTYGDVLAKMLNVSNGPGRGGGMGDGVGNGIGNGNGDGYGKGDRAGAGDGPFRPGTRGVGFPICVYCPDAKYSEEARKAKFQGVVLLQVVVSPDGHATNIQVVRGPGLGLEEQAVEAVKMWRFKPALGPNRQPVATEVAIEVNFRLL